MLKDGSVALFDSEGDSGRIADTLEQFFEFMVNCPFWRDYIKKDAYVDENTLSRFAKEMFEMHVEMARDDLGINLEEARITLAKALDITLVSDISESILPTFYMSALREPRFFTTFLEKDGRTYKNAGTLFD